MTYAELETCQGKVYWNNVLIATLHPKNLFIHKFTKNVKANAGTNTLTI